MDSITANKLEYILSGNGVSSDEFNEVIDLMDNHAKEYHQEQLKNHSDLSNVSGLLKASRYIRGMVTGMIFEYVYRVESDHWYLPLSIGILMCVVMIADCFSNDR